MEIKKAPEGTENQYKDTKKSNIQGNKKTLIQNLQRPKPYRL